MCKKRTAVSHSSAESEIISLDAGLRMEGVPELQLWSWCLRNIFAVRCQGELHAVKRQVSLIFSSMDQFSFGTGDHFPSNIPGSFIPCHAQHFSLQRSSHPNLRHVSRTHHVNLDCPFQRINLDSSSAVRYLRNIEQLADMLTTAAFAVLQRKSLMQFCDFYPPFDLNVDRSLSESSFLKFLERLVSRCRTPATLGETSKVGPGKKSWKIPYTEHAPLCETQRFTNNKRDPQALLGGNHMRCSEHGVAQFDAFWQDVCQETKLDGTSITQKKLFRENNSLRYNPMLFHSTGELARVHRSDFMLVLGKTCKNNLT